MILIKDLIDIYTKHLSNELGYSNNTIQKYQYHLLRFFRDTEIIRLDQITPKSINQEFLYKFWDSFESGRPMSNANKRNYMASLKSFLQFLYKKNFINTDISQNLELPKPEIIFKEALTEEEEKVLSEYFFNNLDTEIGRRDAALFYTLWATGARIDEVLKLRCGPNGYINTKNPLARSGDFSLYKGEVYIYFRGKGKHERMTPIDKVAVGYINYHLQNRGFKSEIIVNNIKNNRNSRIVMSRNAANQRLKVIAQRTGIQKILTTHVFRHTYITKAINKGISTKKIMAAVGITREDTLEWYYRRDKRLVLNFAREDSPLKSVYRSKKQREFEKILAEHY